MTPLLVLVFVIVVKGEVITTGLTTTAGTDLHKDTIGPIEESVTEASRARVAAFAQKYGVEVKNNEEDVRNEENFIRPCAFSNKTCIRKFLSDNSGCKPSQKSVKCLYLAQDTRLLPYINVTFTAPNSTITGLDKAKIREFYYNNKTGNVVLAFQVPLLNETTPEVFITYQRPAKESIVLSDFRTVAFNNILFTAIIPKLPNLRLDLATIHAYLPDGSPSLEIGPNAFASDDPDVKAAYAMLLKSLPILLREFMLFQSQLLTAYYIQRQLCDFGIELYSL